MKQAGCFAKQKLRSKSSRPLGCAIIARAKVWFFLNREMNGLVFGLSVGCTGCGRVGTGLQKRAGAAVFAVKANRKSENRVVAAV